MFARVGDDARENRVVDREGVGRAPRHDAREGDVHERMARVPVQEVIEGLGADLPGMFAVEGDGGERRRRRLAEELVVVRREDGEVVRNGHADVEAGREDLLAPDVLDGVERGVLRQGLEPGAEARRLKREVGALVGRRRRIDGAGPLGGGDRPHEAVAPSVRPFRRTRRADEREGAEAACEQMLGGETAEVRVVPADDDDVAAARPYVEGRVDEDGRAVEPRGAREDVAVGREEDDAIDAPAPGALEALRGDVARVQVEEPRPVFAGVGEDALKDPAVREIRRRQGDEDVRRGRMGGGRCLHARIIAYRAALFTRKTSESRRAVGRFRGCPLASNRLKMINYSKILSIKGRL